MAFINKMSEEILVIRNKRPREENDTMEETGKIKKKRKMAEVDVCQNKHKAKVVSKEKKPHLSAKVFGNDCEISYKQLYKFLKYAVLGKRQSAAQPGWCRLYHQRRLAGVMVVILHEVSQLHFYRYYMQFKHLRRTFRCRFSLPPLSDYFMERLCGTGINGCHPSRQSIDLQKDPIIQKYGEEKQGLSHYVLSPEEMQLNGYPLQGSENCSHFVHTRCNGPVTDHSPLYGLDCEMCLTDKGSELTRLSVVNASGRCIMNELVKPELPIRNYLTRYSGITQELLLPVTTKLTDVQDQLKKLLPPRAVLVGHSLNFDLQALEMVHASVIDTSLLFARKGGQKFKLKFLAKAVLGKEIQCKEEAGHNPTEDAQCALELTQYFINQGPRKVAELNLEARLRRERRSGASQSQVSETRGKTRVQEQMSKPVRCLLDRFDSAGQKTLLLGGCNETASCSLQSTTGALNKEVFQRALAEIPGSAFRVVQFALPSCHVTANVTAEIDAKMRTKLGNLLTVYAGPFGKNVCLKSLKRTFGKYGHVRSITAITETVQPHVRVQYEALEAAQLAVERLNDAEVSGSSIKVQRPVTESTLECEALVKELETDADNEGVIYVAGLKKIQSEKEVQEKLSYLQGLKAVFLPRSSRSGRRRKSCFLKFQTDKSAARALKTIEEQNTVGSQLQSRRALTPIPLHQWVCRLNPTVSKPAAPQLQQQNVHLQEKEQPLSLEQNVKKAVKAFDRQIKKLYGCLPIEFLKLSQDVA